MMFDKVCNSAIQESLNIESLLLRIEKFQLSWFGHANRMPQERLPKQTLFAEVNGKKPSELPRTKWLDYIEDLGWNRLGLRQSKMQSVLVDREMWWLNMELLSPKPSRKSE